MAALQIGQTLFLTSIAADVCLTWVMRCSTTFPPGILFPAAAVYKTAVCVTGLPGPDLWTVPRFYRGYSKDRVFDLETT